METKEENRPAYKCNFCNDISCASQKLNPEELNQISENCCESKFQCNEPIIMEGSFTSHIYYLKSGLVKEFKKHDTGQEYILQIIRAHAYLGLESLFGDKINQYSYTALTEVSICCIDVSIFRKMILENGKFSYEILATVSRDSLNNYQRLMNIRQKQLAGKIADTLLYFSRDIFQNNKYELPLSRNEIGMLIGTGRESVSKQLKEFVVDGLIHCEDRSIELIDIKKLEQIAKFG